MHPDRSFSIYASPYRSKLSTTTGSLRGRIAFSSLPVGNADGMLTWHKPPRPADVMFPDGFTLDRTAMLARFNPPVADAMVINLNATEENADLEISGGTFANIINTLTMSLKNKVTPTLPNTDQVKLVMNKKTGTFSGTFIHPVSKKAVKLFGTVCQQNSTAAGFFVGEAPTEAGDVFIESSQPLLP